MISSDFLRTEALEMFLKYALESSLEKYCFFLKTSRNTEFTTSLYDASK